MTPWRAQILRFAAVGVVGFGVDAGVLYALVRLGANAYAARLVSFPLAVTATWLLNARWTFGGVALPPGRGRRYARYVGVQSVGALTNYGCYALVLHLFEPGATGAVLALAVGSAVGLLVNFTGARLLVFAPRNGGSRT